ncbi:hypothetical protein [Chryseobacterium sp. G0201]|uniref:hypothetical protein n=1 Tax=Chryseobacterium sp. G0201 TaxID=2487065 RepID=UPI000F4FA77E|nr:hypothetical protein [Chryseobacterium sp. G0201]AZA53984.1 hypothetical protein EG348_13735 [Chryseobacterium sp. G0201]
MKLFTSYNKNVLQYTDDYNIDKLSSEIKMLTSIFSYILNSSLNVPHFIFNTANLNTKRQQIPHFVVFAVVLKIILAIFPYFGLVIWWKSKHKSSVLQQVQSKNGT